MKEQQKGSCFTTSRWGAIILLKYQCVICECERRAHKNTLIQTIRRGRDK